MDLQKQSWVMLQDRKYHYQKEGKTICGFGGCYALYEETKPPKKIRCKDCEKKLSPKTTIFFTSGKTEKWDRNKLIEHFKERGREDHFDDIADFFIFQLNQQKIEKELNSDLIKQ